VEWVYGLMFRVHGGPRARSMGSLNPSRQLGDLRSRLNERSGIERDLIYTGGSRSDDRIFLRVLDLTRSDHLNMDDYDLMEAKGYPPLLIWAAEFETDGGG
jgi:hypothetical protein